MKNAVIPSHHPSQEPPPLLSPYPYEPLLAALPGALVVQNSFSVSEALPSASKGPGPPAGFFMDLGAGNPEAMDLGVTPTQMLHA